MRRTFRRWTTPTKFLQHRPSSQSSLVFVSVVAPLLFLMASEAVPTKRILHKECQLRTMHDLTDNNYHLRQCEPCSGDSVMTFPKPTIAFQRRSRRWKTVSLTTSKQRWPSPLFGCTHSRHIHAAASCNQECCKEQNCGRRYCGGMCVYVDSLSDI